MAVGFSGALSATFVIFRPCHKVRLRCCKSRLPCQKNETSHKSRPPYQNLRQIFTIAFSRRGGGGWQLSSGYCASSGLSPRTKFLTSPYNTFFYIRVKSEKGNSKNKSEREETMDYQIVYISTERGGGRGRKRERRREGVI